MRNSLILYFTLTLSTVLFGQLERSAFHFNIVNSVGISQTWSKVYANNIPSYNKQSSTFSQYSIACEFHYFVNPIIGFGVGGGINFRNHSYYGPKNYSDKYYFSIQGFNKNGRFLTQFNLGTIRGVVTNKMMFHFSIGTSIRLLSEEVFDLKVKPFLEYSFEESMENYYMDPHLYNSVKPPKYYYNEYFKTLSLNIGLVMNFKSKPKVIMIDLHE